MKMPTDDSPSKKKCQWGGKRARAGRHPIKTIRIWVTVQRETAAILLRLAKSSGLVKRKGGKPFLGTVVDELASKVATPEPEYLKLAREVQEQAAAV